MTTSFAISREKYLHEAQYALFACQMVEESLKSLLMYAREVNLPAPDQSFLQCRTDEELDELPLGPLIKSYEKLFPMSSVSASLHALRPERNHCAHRALVIGFLSEVRTDISLSAEFERIACTRQLAWHCFASLNIELQTIAKRLEKLRDIC